MKLTKFIILFSLFITSLILVPNAKAVEPTPTPKAIQKRQEVQRRIEERKTERVVKLNAVRKERILSFSNKMIVRLEATIERIEKLVTRIEARIAKIESEDSDVDIEPIKTSLDEAKEALALIKIETVSFKEALLEMPESDDPKTLFEEAREGLNKIKDGLKDVHLMLVELIGDIKGLRVGGSNE